MAEALEIFESCGDDHFLDVIDDPSLKKAFDELKQICHKKDSELTDEFLSQF